MLLHDTAAKCETEAGASQGASVRCVSLLEAIKNVFQLFGGDAMSLVFDLETDLVLTLMPCAQANECIGQREFDRVRYQLVEHLENAIFIGEHVSRRCLDSEGDVQNWRILYFTNDTRYAGTLPKTIDDWRERFRERPIVYMSQKAQ